MTGAFTVTDWNNIFTYYLIKGINNIFEKVTVFGKKSLFIYTKEQLPQHN
jgi:hypothetical protein